MTVSAAPWWRWRAQCPVGAPPLLWWTVRVVPAPQGLRRWPTPAAGTSVHSASTAVLIWQSISGAFMWTDREEGSVDFKLFNVLHVDLLYSAWRVAKNDVSLFAVVLKWHTLEIQFNSLNTSSLLFSSLLFSSLLFSSLLNKLTPSLLQCPHGLISSRSQLTQMLLLLTHNTETFLYYI